MESHSAERVLSSALAAAGVTTAFGRPLGNIPMIDVKDPQVAILLAGAHQAVNGTGALAHIGDGELVVVGRRSVPESPGGLATQDWRKQMPTRRMVIDDPRGLFELGGLIRDARDSDGMCISVRIDLETRLAQQTMAAPVTYMWEQPDLDLVRDLVRAGQLVILAGPGVIEQDCVGGLRALAAVGRCGVLNTWGAKGVFHWQSRHHLATAGLQAWDFELGGLQEADLVVGVGLDPRESPDDLLEPFPHRIIDPHALGPLAEQMGGSGSFPVVPPLRSLLAGVTQGGWVPHVAPLKPSLVTRHYAEVLGSGGLIAADPGVAGFWVARTFSTTKLGTVFVPSGRTRGWAAACVCVARLRDPLRRGLAAVDGPLDGMTLAVLETAARLGIVIGIEAWETDGQVIEAEAHRHRLEGLIGRSGGQATVMTDNRQLVEMTDVAGPVRAWATAAG